MQCWINGPATDGIDDKIKMANILLIRLRRTNVPPLHYSIFGANSEVPKNLYNLHADGVIEIPRH
jgi:hypothetical protein